MPQHSRFQGYDQVILNPSPAESIPSAIRGFSLPADYISFLSEHNGAHLIADRSELQLDEVHVILFSLEEVASCSRCRDSFGGYLGSELTMSGEFQNTAPGIRTTANETPIHQAQTLFERFHLDHLIIGYVWSWWEEPIRYINLIGIGHDGLFFLAGDMSIEHGTPYYWQGNSFQELIRQAKDI